MQPAVEISQSERNDKYNKSMNQTRYLHNTNVDTALDAKETDTANDTEDGASLTSLQCIDFSDHFIHGAVLQCQSLDFSDKSIDGHEQNFKPPDGGYGWFVVFGCFLTHILVGGLERGSGIFLLQFLKKFNQNNQVTSWPIAVVSATFLLLGPLITAFSSRFSARTSLMVGGLLMSVGLILTSFSDNFYFLFLYFSLIYGVGMAFCYAPSLIIINQYFDKRRSFAVGLGSSGIGVGTITLVPIIQLLFDSYSFSGAFLILGALSLNMNVIGMIFRPLSMHLSFNKNIISSSQFDVTALPNTMTVLKENTNGIESLDKNDYMKKYTTKTSIFKDAINIILPVDTSFKTKAKNNKLFDFNLLKDASFFVYCTSICLFTLAFKTGLIFMPALITSKGVSEDGAALIIALSGITDTLSRILTGMVLDHPKLRPERPFIYTCFMFAATGITFILPSLQDFWTFSLVTSISAIFTGAYICQKSVILVDIVGPENMANSFGILICVQGLGSIIGPPISGFLTDKFGSYDGSFYFGGSCMLVSSFLMVISNIYLVLKRKKLVTERTVTKIKLQKL